MQQYVRARCRWLAACTLTLATVGVWSIAEANSITSSGGSPARRLSPEAMQQLADGAQAARARSERLEQALAKPSSEAAAAASAHRFGDLDRMEARDVLKAQEPGIVEGEGWANPEKASDDRFTPITSTTGILEDPDGPDALVRSSIPMAFSNDEGGLEQVDLSLNTTDSGLQPKSSPVPLTLPDTADGLVTLGTGSAALGIRSSGAPGAVATKTATGVFYANIATDTDLFFKPVLGGVESFHVLRTVDSPETLGLDLDLPAGASLRNSARGGQEIVVDGRPIASISAAVARDQDGRDVPVTVDTHLDGLVLRVPHRADTYKYPIVVDPTYDYVGECWSSVSQATAACQFFDWEQSPNSGYGNTFAGWWFWSDNNDGNSRYGGHFEGDAWLGRGLYLWNLGYYNFFRTSPGDWGGQSVYKVKDSTRIFRAAFANLSTDNPASNATCGYVGIYNIHQGTWFPYSPHYIGSCAATTMNQTFWACDVNCNRNAGQPGNAVYFGVIGQNRWADRYAHHVGTIVTYITDDAAPAITQVPAPAPDINDPNYSMQYKWTDDGVGVKRITWKLDGQPWTPTTTAGTDANYYCSQGAGGDVTYQCISGADQWTLIKVGSLPPGNHRIQADIVDVVGHHGYSDVTITVSGYATSGIYGGANQSIDTDAEFGNLVTALEAASDSEARNLLAAMMPSDREAFNARIAAGDTQLAPMSSVLGSPLSPTTADLVALGSSTADDEAEATAAALGNPKRGCRDTHDKTQIKVNLPWPLPDLNLGHTEMSIRFCWDAYKHTTSFSSLQRFEVNLKGKYEMMGYDYVKGSDWDTSLAWGGYPRGAVQGHQNFDIKFCQPLHIGSCSTEARFTDITEGHADGTAREFQVTR